MAELDSKLTLKVEMSPDFKEAVETFTNCLNCIEKRLDHIEKFLKYKHPNTFEKESK